MNETIHFLTEHGAAVLFAVVFVEQIGLPLPAFPFLIAAGALVGTGQMALGGALGSAIVGALLGDQLWFELGRRRGRGVSLSLSYEELIARHHDLPRES
jgi:membrane protein DedA with SNARE-associated domain